MAAIPARPQADAEVEEALVERVIRRADRHAHRLEHLRRQVSQVSRRNLHEVVYGAHHHHAATAIVHSGREAARRCGPFGRGAALVENDDEVVVVLRKDPDPASSLHRFVAIESVVKQMARPAATGKAFGETSHLADEGFRIGGGRGVRGTSSLHEVNAGRKAAVLVPHHRIQRGEERHCVQVVRPRAVDRPATRDVVSGDCREAHLVTVRVEAGAPTAQRDIPGDLGDGVVRGGGDYEIGLRQKHPLQLRVAVVPDKQRHGRHQVLILFFQHGEHTGTEDGFATGVPHENTRWPAPGRRGSECQQHDQEGRAGYVAGCESEDPLGRLLRAKEGPPRAKSKALSGRSQAAGGEETQSPRQPGKWHPSAGGVPGGREGEGPRHLIGLPERGRPQSRADHLP